jgi:hypothetical protein
MREDLAADLGEFGIGCKGREVDLDAHDPIDVGVELGFSGRTSAASTSSEAEAVDRPIEHAGSRDLVASQSGDESQCLPVAMRHFVHQALPHGAVTVRAGLGPGLIDEHQPCGVNLVLVSPPMFAPTCDVRSILFAGAQAFL